jgi:hypothetical protein
MDNDAIQNDTFVYTDTGNYSWVRKKLNLTLLRVSLILIS